MSDFSYILPDEGKYYSALLQYLRKTKEDDLFEILRNAKCSISPKTSYSRKRWNAMWTQVYFYVPSEVYDSIDEDITDRLRVICDKIMPRDAGYDVMDVVFSIDLDQDIEEKRLEDDLKEINIDLQKKDSSFNLPSDILEKGHRMTEVYLYLYVVENYIRIFIRKVGSELYGIDYFNNFKIPISISKNIVMRKQLEKKNQWMSIRGDSELFYLDFKDLSAIISNNWDLFGKYFPDQAWILSKIDELSNCRNLVAHNSYVGDHERDVIRVNFNSITKQLKGF